MKPVYLGKRVVMARKSQNIKIVIHTPENMASVLFNEQVTSFWKEKIDKKINENNLDKEEREYLRKNWNRFFNSP